MFEAGTHYGYSRRKRHPSVKDYIYGVKNRVEIWDIEKTLSFLDRAKEFVRTLGKEGKQLLLVAGKNEARKSIKAAAEKLELPYVAGRWIGGALTNFNEIKGRVARYEKLLEEKEKGELLKYTKKERLGFDKEIEKLERNFKGLVKMKGMPTAMFIIDPKAEHISLSEAKKAHIKTIALLNTDCDMRSVDYPIPGNDASVKSIDYFINEIAKAYEEGKNSKEL
jgi:small subunit ribosomal protein S2